MAESSKWAIRRVEREKGEKYEWVLMRADINFEFYTDVAKIYSKTEAYRILNMVRDAD